MKKGALELEKLGKWIIALLILVLIVITILLLRKTGIDIIEKIIEFLRFRR